MTDYGGPIYGAAMAVTIVSMFALVCCFGRAYPLNLALLFLFTCGESVMVGGITAAYDPKTVGMAGLAAALVTIALTIYALRTSASIEIFVAMAYILYFAMFPFLMFSCLWIRNKVANTIWCCVGLIFYSLFLIIDTMLIFRSCDAGTAHSYVTFGYDDAILGAMMLYLDIIMIFLYLL